MRPDGFAPFLEAFDADETRLEARPWMANWFRAATGYESLATLFAGRSFNRGLYRVHDLDSGPVAQRLIAEAFPDFSTRAVPFGCDWMGRQFAVDLHRVIDGEPLVLMFEPGTGQALEIPCDFERFHNAELVEFRDAVLASDFFDEWQQQEPIDLPLPRTHCVGYRVPLFLGGSDTLENLEVTDLDVYWSISGQLRLGLL